MRIQRVGRACRTARQAMAALATAALALAMGGCGSGVDEPPIGSADRTTSATTGNCDDWRFWLCTNSTPAFNPGGTCGNGSGGSGCGCSSDWCSCFGDDLDWSQGPFWNHYGSSTTGQAFLPCDATYLNVSTNFITLPNGWGYMWEPHFQCVSGSARGAQFWVYPPPHTGGEDD